jgi:hypothetical protein
MQSRGHRQVRGKPCSTECYGKTDIDSQPVAGFSRTPRSVTRRSWSLEGPVAEDIMSKNYDGLPAAANVEQAIVLAQLMILRDLERRAKLIKQQTAPVQLDLRPAA